MKKTVFFIIAVLSIMLSSLSFTLSKYSFDKKVLTINIDIKKYTITFDHNYNIINNPYLTGSKNSPSIIYGSNQRADLTAENGVFIVTAKMDDGYAHSKMLVNLKKNNYYHFKVDTDGNYLAGGKPGTDTQEMFLFQNSIIDSSITADEVYLLNSNDYFFEFTTGSGPFAFRFDVNQKDKTHTFSNVWISNAEKKEYFYYDKYGSLPLLTRSDYTFEGWYDEKEEKISEDDIITEDKILYAKWKPVN